MTEEDAKKKVCPLIGLLAMTTLHASLKAISLDLPDESKKGLEKAIDTVDAYCLGSGCMMWVPYSRSCPGEGDCGLKQK